MKILSLTCFKSHLKYTISLTNINSVNLSEINKLLPRLTVEDVFTFPLTEITF